MPLQTEAKAVLEELQPNGIRREDTLKGYARSLAKAQLASTPDDDETVTTNAWLISVGGTNASPSVFTIGAGLTLSFATVGSVTTPTIVATNPAATVLPVTSTRGAVRRLVGPLGITLTGLG